MLPAKEILNLIVSNYYDILKDNLVGIYLHGSLAMECFNPDSSDIDFLVVINEIIDFKVKRKLIDVLLGLSDNGPKKGFEMSVILKRDVEEFQYPTPFILHYSEMYKERYLNKPDFICGDSVDPDLAAHIAVTINKGICLFGKPINEVFKAVPEEYYIESIMNDIASAKGCIVDNPVYFILNLCRVLYYLKEGAICSKKEGGEWGYMNLPFRYKNIIKSALEVYKDANNVFQWESELLIDYANFLLGEINTEYESIKLLGNSRITFRP